MIVCLFVCLFICLFVCLFVHFPAIAPPPTGLYFRLNDTLYLPGETVLISGIGVSNFIETSDEGSALLCVTTNVNQRCCRGSDGGNVGEWFFPDGSMVPRRRDEPENAFARTGYTQQVRLNRKDNAIMPTGAYSCRVPMSGTGTEISAVIILSKTLLLQ